MDRLITVETWTRLLPAPNLRDNELHWCRRGDPDTCGQPVMCVEMGHPTTKRRCCAQCVAVAGRAGLREPVGDVANARPLSPFPGRAPTDRARARGGLGPHALRRLLRQGIEHLPRENRFPVTQGLQSPTYRRAQTRRALASRRAPPHAPALLRRRGATRRIRTSRAHMAAAEHDLRQGTVTSARMTSLAHTFGEGASIVQASMPIIIEPEVCGTRP